MPPHLIDPIPQHSIQQLDNLLQDYYFKSVDEHKQKENSLKRPKSSEGDIVYERFCGYVNRMLSPSKTQSSIIRILTTSFLPIIYGSEFPRKKEALAAKFDDVIKNGGNNNTFPKFVQVITSRREGKTMATLGKRVHI